MSSNDGRRSEDGFFNNHSPIGGVPPLARMPPPQPTSGGNIPPPIMWSPPPLLNQQYIHHQQHSQPPAQQQYNEIFYNMHAQAFASPSVQPETYSVLPVGHGNFLKVYHRPEGTAPACSGTDAILYQQQFQQQQHQPSYHPAPQQSQPIYNSYELFSSNSLIPTAENTVTPTASLNIPAQEVPLPPSLQMLGNNADILSTPTGSTTNKIINKLVNNWSPNLTGGSYAQFTAPVSTDNGQTSTVPINSTNNIHMDSQFPNQIPIQQQLPVSVNPITNFQEAPFSNMVQFAAQPQLQTGFLPQNQLPSNSESPNHQPVSEDIPLPPTADVSTNVNTNGTFKEQAAINTPSNVSTMMPSVNQSQPEGSKKRIVAEVKPMRMTYSDVLSKFNNQNVTPPPTATAKSNTNKTNQKQSGTGISQTFNERKTENKRSADVIGTTAQRQACVNDANIQHKANNKSPTHDKENLQDSANGTKPNNKRLFNNTNSTATNKNTQKTTQKSSTVDAHPTVNNTTKKRSNKRADTDCNSDGSGKRYNNKSSSSSSTGAGKRFNGFYNVTAKNDNYETNTKATNNKSQYQRWKKNPYYFTEGLNQKSMDMYRSARAWKPFKRSRDTGSTSGGTQNRNRNYELAKKLLNKWFEYLLKVLNWLFYLIYDIVVLGFSILYERLSYYYTCGFAYVKQLRKELKQNSNKPSTWLKNYWRRFDARFKKNSKWAFWRRFYKKKQPEVSAEFYKNGRLPQTGEEAMYSLLNCKGKDAYSILGVPPDSSQEQIRKHYKKIAVLVHPDKNKQAGAEEAFKVLQRAFELIGEPENREAYDRSLDEALHAEKAWTELHDLLSQLQTKITEAANTIRCSTCGLRHPRKLNDRPQYAARECASCKIRHSAREGDIWAETTMMGLRWKYLALMDGKVFDITEWANCQKGALSHLEPNSHMVQYRIVRGAQQQQQAHQQSHGNHTHPQYQNPHSQGGSKYKRDIPPSEASLHEFLDNLYSGQHPNGQPNANAFSGSTKKRTRRN